VQDRDVSSDESSQGWKSKHSTTTQELIMRRTLTLLLAAVAALAVLVPATASARTTNQRTSATADRNHDRIPDRWERRHRLSLRIKQTRRDQDRDGLNNLGEFKSGTNPRDRDSDDDGVRDGSERRHGMSPTDRDSDDDGRNDGHENAGTVTSFDGTKLTITLASGGTVTGNVDDSTEIECKRPATTTPTATASREDEPGDDRGGDDRGGDDGDNDDHSGPGRGGDDDPGDDDHGERGDDDDEVACSKSDLTAGTVVHEAELKLTDGVAVFREVELVK
jgi:hypothetical protein